MAHADLPRWQLESIYAGLQSAEYRHDRNALGEQVDALEAFLDERRVRAPDEGGDTAEPLATLESLIAHLNGVYETLQLLHVYLGDTLSVDASDDRARAELTSLDPVDARLSALMARVTAWVGALDIGVLALRSKVVAEHAYALRRIQSEALHLMGEEAEALAAALDGSGASAWERLHNDLISQRSIRARIPEEAEPKDFSVAELYVALADPREEVRRTAFDAQSELLESDAVVHAAALNGVKGQTRELAHRRGWSSVLESTLFDNAIDEESLTAMRTATAETAPTLRRYLRAKASFLGKEALRWWDLQAPVSTSDPQTFSWDEAKRFVVDRFGRYSERLAEFATRAFEEGWVDVPPRPGKRNGAFCSPVFGRKESRVMLNFGGRLNDVFTLAHELGHAYHNDCLYRHARTLLQTQLPMTLAETASIFCETLVVNGLLDEAGDAEALAILEQDLRQTTQLVLDIDARFRFESALVAQRAERALAPVELDALMQRSQREAYGEGLAEGPLHRLAWAEKPHYYLGGRSFYNYPYTFGFLFGRGLYSAYRDDPDGFIKRYDELLAGTGLADAVDLAGSFDMDIRDPAFWRSSLAVAEERVERYAALVGRMTP